MNNAKQAELKAQAQYQAFCEKVKKYIEILELEKIEEELLDDYERLCERNIKLDDKTIETMTQIKDNIQQRQKQEQSQYPNYKDYQIWRDEFIKSAHKDFLD